MCKKIIKIAVINYEKVLTSSLVGMLDIFSIVNTFILGSEHEYAFETEILHTDKIITNFNISINLKSRPINYQDHYDLVIIPPIIDTEFQFDENTKLIEWLNYRYLQNSIICSVCVGAYVLAQSGLLNNRRATSHWLIESKIKHDFPKVNLDVHKLIIEDENIITAGGASAYIYLCLYIVRKFISSQAAYTCANYLGVDAGKKSQQHYKDLTQIATENDRDIELIVAWLKENLTEAITVNDMAKKISVSERTLIRKFKKSTGELPNNFLQKLRVQKAKELLINTCESFEQITYIVGYTSPSTFRKLFKEATDLSPIDYRKLFMAK